VAIYTGAKALSRWPINDESTLTYTRRKETGLSLQAIAFIFLEQPCPS
jgi:hypothetical protein